MGKEVADSERTVAERGNIRPEGRERVEFLKDCLWDHFYFRISCMSSFQRGRVW